MRIYNALVSFNGGGGHPTLSFIGDLLLGTSPPCFGDAVKSVEAFAHLECADPPLPSLEAMHLRFRERLATMPQAWFRRKTNRIELAYHSFLGDAKGLIIGKARRAELNDVPLVRSGLAELMVALERIRKSVKVSDDFNVPSFLGFLQDRHLMICGAADSDVLQWLREAQEVERQRAAHFNG